METAIESESRPDDERRDLFFRLRVPPSYRAPKTLRGATNHSPSDMQARRVPLRPKGNRIRNPRSAPSSVPAHSPAIPLDVYESYPCRPISSTIPFLLANRQILHSIPASSESKKYSISICSNSRVRKIKLPGVISFSETPADLRDAKWQRAFATRRQRAEVHKHRLRRLRTKIGDALHSFSSAGPINVLNMRLKSVGCDQSVLPAMRTGDSSQRAGRVSASFSISCLYFHRRMIWRRLFLSRFPFS